MHASGEMAPRLADLLGVARLPGRVPRRPERRRSPRQPPIAAVGLRAEGPCLGGAAVRAAAGGRGGAGMKAWLRSAYRSIRCALDPRVLVLAYHHVRKHGLTP